MTDKDPDEFLHSRALNFRASLGAAATAKLSAAQHRFEVALAQAYGSRLSDLVITRLIDRFTLDPLVLSTVLTDVSELPSTG